MVRALGFLIYLISGVLALSALGEAINAVVHGQLLETAGAVAGILMILWLGAGLAIRLGAPLPPPVERLPLFRRS